jgi:hypothetical protein
MGNRQAKPADNP